MRGKRTSERAVQPCPPKRIDEDQGRSSPHRGKIRGTPSARSPRLQPQEERPMGALYVGLDVHSRETVFVIQDETGTIVGRGAAPTTPDGLARMCHDYHLPAGTTVGLETGTSAFCVARALAALGLNPVVIDAHEFGARRIALPRRVTGVMRLNSATAYAGASTSTARSCTSQVRRSAGCDRAYPGGATSFGSKRPRSTPPNACCAGPVGCSGLRRCSALRQCQARGQLRRPRAQHLPVRRLRPAWPHHQTRLG